MADEQRISNDSSESSSSNHSVSNNGSQTDQQTPSENSFWSIIDKRYGLRGGAGAQKHFLSRWRKEINKPGKDKKSNDNSSNSNSNDSDPKKRSSDSDESNKNNSSPDSIKKKDSVKSSSDSSIEFVHEKKVKKTKSSSTRNQKGKEESDDNETESDEIVPDPKYTKKTKKQSKKSEKTSKTNNKRKREEDSDGEKSDDSIAESDSILIISQPGYTVPPPVKEDDSNPNPSSGRLNKKDLIVHKHNYQDVNAQHWKQFFFWNVPFINLLESAAHQQISLQDYLQNTIPLKERRILEAQARTAKYTALDDALGNTLQQVGEGLGFPVEQTGSKSRDRTIFKAVKVRIADKYRVAYKNMVSVSEMLGCSASVFWSFPPIYLFPLMARIGNILGDRSPTEYHEYIQNLFKDLIVGNYLYPNECVDNFMEFFDEDSLDSDFRFGYQHATRLLSCHRRTRAGCQETPSKRARVEGDNDMHRVFRLASDGNHQRYVANSKKMIGIRFPRNDETNHLLETPISTLGFLILRVFKTIMEDDIFEQLRNKFVSMIAELDTCLQVSMFTNEEDSAKENNLGNVYGFSTDNSHYLRPWENMFQHSTFARQVSSVMKGLRLVYDTPVDRDETDNDSRLSMQQIFERFVDDFIFCALTAEKPIFKEISMFKFSILHLPFRAYIRDPQLMYKQETPKKTTGSKGRKKAKK